MSTAPNAAELGIVACHACGLVSRMKPEAEGLHCPRCHAPLHQRKRNSIHRTWAFLIAAIILYIPANLLPIMRTATFFDEQDDTILSGVVVLWRAGSWDLAIIVFVASIVVPVLKIGVLMLLLVTVQMRSRWCQAERARLYRIVEFVGHWSMLDVFVVALLVALVHFKSFAEVLPGGGAVAFAAVVILTMLASLSFDPRLIWDEPDPSTSESETRP